MKLHVLGLWLVVFVLGVTAAGLGWYWKKQSDGDSSPADSRASATDRLPATGAARATTANRSKSGSGVLFETGQPVSLGGTRPIAVSPPGPGSAAAHASGSGQRTCAEPRLVDVAASVGIDFTYFADFRADRFLLPENMGGGAAWLDYDGDGRLDLFLTNGCRIPPHLSDRTYVQQLYRQDPFGQFESVASAAGADVVAYGQGCAAGDLDNDGFPDLFVTCYGHNVLLHNNGDGTFENRTEPSGVADPGWSTCAALGDYDRDGDLDLYVAHYAVISLEKNPVCYYGGAANKIRGYCGPDSYQAEPDSLFRNEDGLRFVRVNDQVLGTVKPYHGLGVVFADFNNDGWPEIFVANDMDPNFLFQNLGGPDPASVKFSEIGMSSGVAVSGDGTPEACMGIACADFEGNDYLHLYLTNYYMQKNTYYHNSGQMHFQDQSAATGLAAPSLPYLGFGTVPIDYDMDGWQDLFVTNGHVLGKFLKPYAMRPQLYRNQGKAHFVELKPESSPYFREEWVGRGAAMADYDNDGDEDIVVIHQDDRPMALLRNDTPRAATVIGFELIGTVSNRTAAGTRIHVRAGNEIRMRELVGGGSYLGSNDPRILVGLSPGQRTAAVDVSWPSGQMDHWDALEAGRYWRLYEGCVPIASPRWDAKSEEQPSQ